MKTTIFENQKFEPISLGKLHQESRNWLSAIAFWKDEVRFMQNLINKNFVYFFSNNDKDSLKVLLKRIQEMEKTKLDTLKKKVINHEKHLADYSKNKTDFNEQIVRKEHAVLTNDLDLFQTNYRLIKTELFRLAEEVLKEKDIKQLVVS
jgi:tRNA U34 5-carboxymethylaminomethyl modifying GTPase MnmE/TrmE